MAAHAARLKAALLRCGHTAFRRGQLEAVTATLEGKDSFLILPTGGGKSLTFQASWVVTDAPMWQELDVA